MLAEEQKAAYLDGWGLDDMNSLAKQILATEGGHYPTIIIETVKKDAVVIVEDFSCTKTFPAAKESLCTALAEHSGASGSIIFVEDNSRRLYRYRYIGWFRLEAL